MDANYRLICLPCLCSYVSGKYIDRFTPYHNTLLTLMFAVLFSTIGCVLITHISSGYPEIKNGYIRRLFRPYPAILLLHIYRELINPRYQR